jgi:hypothetical protein
VHGRGQGPAAAMCVWVCEQRDVRGTRRAGCLDACKEKKKRVAAALPCVPADSSGLHGLSLHVACVAGRGGATSFSICPHTSNAPDKKTGQRRRRPRAATNSERRSRQAGRQRAQHETQPAAGRAAHARGGGAHTGVWLCVRACVRGARARGVGLRGSHGRHLGGSSEGAHIANTLHFPEPASLRAFVRPHENMRVAFFVTLLAAVAASTVVAQRALSCR